MTKALLLYPAFSQYSFWNYSEVCRLQGAKYPAAPLGLITLAALLPQDWDIHLVDMNTAALPDEQILWADLVFIGGMLPQQNSFLELIERVHGLGRKVVAGGPDPTSQPEIYARADYRVLGEGESTVSLFLEDLAKGAPNGVYHPAAQRPDMCESPIPRFDLLRLKDYLMIGIQFSRGCPFNCEFCDIIELYGRKPRTKSPQQVVNELQALHDLGYRGHIDFVDDNFIGNKPSVKAILRAVKIWSEENHYPFYFSTEASINLADDTELLGLMRDIDFRYVFIGIESADEGVLEATQKKQNTRRTLADDLNRIYSYGMVVNGGFIIGFDNESRENARSIAAYVQSGKVCMAMVGLLHALPNTQLTRRLKRENRFVQDSNNMAVGSHHSIDQTTAGLNFLTTRSRKSILQDYVYVIRAIYSRKSYFNRCINLSLSLRTNQMHKPGIPQRIKSIRVLIRIILRLGLLPPVSYYFWRSLFVVLALNPFALEALLNLMAMYLHFRKQSRFVVRVMKPA